MNAPTAHPHHAALHHDPQAAANAIALMEESRLRDLAAKQRHFMRAFFTGRVLLGAVFIVGAVSKAMTFEATRHAMDDFGFQLTVPLLAFAIGLEALGGALLIVGFKTRAAAFSLAVWLSAITVIVYGNLSIETNRMFAVANLAIISALLMLFAHGAGRGSIDDAARRREASEG